MCKCRIIDSVFLTSINKFILFYKLARTDLKCLILSATKFRKITSLTVPVGSPAALQRFELAGNFRAFV